MKRMGLTVPHIRRMGTTLITDCVKVTVQMELMRRNRNSNEIKMLRVVISEGELN